MASEGSGASAEHSESVEKLKYFIENFDADDGLGEQKYMKLLQQVANRRTRLVEIELDDVMAGLGSEMVEKMRENTHRYKQLLEKAVDECLPAATADLGRGDIADVLMASRNTQANDEGSSDPAQRLPAKLKRRWQVVIIPESKQKHMPLRSVKAANIGKLVSVKGIVTRVSEVKAQLSVATYTCETGGWEIYQEVNERTFMPLFKCPVEACCGVGRLHLQTRGCKFEKFQEVKIQEEADQACTCPIMWRHFDLLCLNCIDGMN